MSMVSRWPVLITVTLLPDELDAGSRLTPAGIERVFDEARRAYVDQCGSLAPLTLTDGRRDVRPGDARVLEGSVRVAAGVTEVFPDSFEIAARIQARDASGIVAEVSCSVSAGSELPKACIDEMIALAHNARHLA